uniref:Uncharacterized protein n=1 Tax=Avena sativa TaxID=4498 RepID=A0ACD5TN85_AVESA
MIHCSPVEVVSVPALRNSPQRLTISSSVRGRFPSSGSLMSSRVFTYECSNVVSFLGSPPRLLYSRRALISGTLPHGVRCLEAVAEYVLGERREEGEDGHPPGDVEQMVALCGCDVAHRGLVEPLAEAHEHEETEHGVLERLHDARPAGGIVSQLLEEHAAHPGARGREQADARRVQRLGDEVAAKEAPHGPVASARDGVVVLAQKREGGEGRPVGQRGAALDERRMREAAVCDEDGEAGSHAQRHDGAVLREKAPEEGLYVGERVLQQHHAAQHRHRRRPRREAAPQYAAALAVAEEEED